MTRSATDRSLLARWRVLGRWNTRSGSLIAWRIDAQRVGPRGKADPEFIDDGAGCAIHDELTIRDPLHPPKPACEHHPVQRLCFDAICQIEKTCAAEAAGGDQRVDVQEIAR